MPLKRKVSTFSKGMRRRVFLALALSSSCPILLLDEAFDDLDSLALDYIKEKIVELGRENRTIVIATHNLSSLEKLADRIVLLYKGELQKDSIEEGFSSNLTKYQAMFTKEINEQYLVDKGFEVVSFKKMGSIYNFVVVENKIAEEKIKEDKPLLFEIVLLEGDEVFASRMMLAKKEGKQND